MVVAISNSMSMRADESQIGVVSHRMSLLEVSANDVVIIVRLEKAAQYNYRAGIILQTNPDGRLAVQLLHGDRKTLACRRCNLLRAEHPEDRARLLIMVVWERQLELQVCKSFLLEQLQGEEGLALHIASFFPARQTMALTTGFADGRIVPTWSCATLTASDAPAGLQWRPIHQLHRRDQAVFGADKVKDGIVRIDCAVVEIGDGRFVVAGGCDDHPRRARSFFKSAFIYDSLAHTATALPDMPCRRHGCGGALIGGKVFIVGGGYVDSDGTMCAVLDLVDWRWSPLDAAEMDGATLERIGAQAQLEASEPSIAASLMEELRRPIAFVPVRPACKLPSHVCMHLERVHVREAARARC